MAKKSDDEPVAKLSVRVTPRASTNAVVGYIDGVLSVRLTAPPVEGAANEACCTFVAGVLGVSKSHVTVAGGAHNRNKVLAIRGLTPSELQRALASACPAKS